MACGWPCRISLLLVVTRCVGIGWECRTHTTRRCRSAGATGISRTAHVATQVETINSMVALEKLRVPDQGGCDWFLIMDCR
jgi:hypothetical protein